MAEAHHACVDGEPSLVLELLGGLSKEVGVGRVSELDVDPELVAGLVMRLDGHGLDVLRVHPVDIDVHWELGLAGVVLCFRRHSRHSSSFSSHVGAAMFASYRSV